MSWKYLSNLEINLIRKEHSAGTSGCKIARNLNRNPSVINRCIKRGITSGTRDFSIKLKPDSDKALGEFIGAFAGDGNFYLGKNGSYRTTLFLNETESQYANYLGERMSYLFDIKPNIWPYKKGHMVYVIIHRKAVYDLIKSFLYRRERERENLYGQFKKPDKLL